MALTLEIGYDVTQKFVRFQVYCFLGCYVNFEFELSCSLDFNKVKANFGDI